MPTRTVILACTPKCNVCGTPMTCDHPEQQWVCVSVLHALVQRREWGAAAREFLPLTETR